ncbi:MAG: hypothetical protein ACOY4K_06385 [Pseudomonadota bacterium]
MTPITLHHDGLSRPLDAPRLRILSLGLGVQSVTLALMAERGELGPKPDFALWAETPDPKHTFDYLDYLRPLLSFPIVEVKAGDLEADILQGVNTTSHDWCAIPAFVENEDGEVALLRRQCTQEYKLHPIIAEVRSRLGLKPRQSIRHFLRLRRDEPTPRLVEMWVGISMDGIERLAQSPHKYIHNRHPLVEARMSRRDCEAWLRERQYRVPGKSACVFCPFRSNAEWAAMKAESPADFDRAVAVDRAIRGGNPSIGMRTTKMGVHRSLRPLEEIDFSEPETDQRRFGFVNECLGMCGV